MEIINAIGRRKGAVARVYASSGKGNIKVNGRELADYFPQPHIYNKVTAPFQAIDAENVYDWKINVTGGGFSRTKPKLSGWVYPVP